MVLILLTIISQNGLMSIPPTSVLNPEHSNIVLMYCEDFPPCTGKCDISLLLGHIQKRVGRGGLPDFALRSKINKVAVTPWEINMEPTNQPFRKENDLPNLHDYVPCQSSGVYWEEDHPNLCNRCHYNRPSSY